MKIIEISACSNIEAQKKLNFRGDPDNRIVFMIKSIIDKENPDVLSIRDIAWHSIKRLRSHMLGYSLYFPIGFKEIKEKWRYTCLSVMYVRNGIKFQQLSKRENFPTKFRYLLCELEIPSGEKIVYRTSHMPCVNDSRSNLTAQIARKRLMLQQEIDFQKKHDCVLAISSGDYNGRPGAPEGEYYCQELLDQIPFADLIDAPTYENKRLDHVFISDTLKNSDNISATAKVLEGYGTLTDHKPFVININIKG